MDIETRISLTIEDRIARVRLNRPEKHNALDLDMFRCIVEAQKKVARERSVRAVILSGEGVDFCTGLDVKALMDDRAGMIKLLWKWLPWRANLAQRVSVGWRELSVPVFAAVHGRCWGGGLQIALGADFRIVKPDASLSIMEGKWGLIPDMGGTLGLRELTARDQAAWLAMTATEITGQRAFELGLVTRLAQDPNGTALEMAAELMGRSPAAVAGVKHLFRKSWSGSAGRSLARETGYQIQILRKFKPRQPG